MSDEPSRDELPCGNCASGVYALEAIRNGYARYGDCKTEAEALALRPPCKHYPRPCIGATDFITAMFNEPPPEELGEQK